MRCRIDPPAHVKCFPEYLRNAGYYCTNNKKTDYNFDVPTSAWDESSGNAHWRGRAPGQPFFAVFNFTVTHESGVGTPPEVKPERLAVLRPEDRHDPAKLTLPPYYPDTPIVRKHWAHYYDLITVMDQKAGEILAQLEEDGLADDTIVFYYSDHGVGLPRAKRWLYDAGLHVPFIVRWPGVIRPGTVREDPVSFVDFAPTVLSLAGVDVPPHMQGQVFLGDEAAEPREYVFAARDRMDERYDIIRAVRDKRYKYIRNYEPYRPYDQYLNYPEHWPVLMDMRRVQREGKLKGPEKLFFQQSKPLEELYDLEVDPHEIHNVADSPEYRRVLERMRRAHDEWMIETEDLGLVPEVEIELWLKPGGKREKRSGSVPYKSLPGKDGEIAFLGKSLNDWIADLRGTNPFVRLKAIRMLGEAGPEAAPVLIEALDDPDSAVVYWAEVALGNLRPQGADAEKPLYADLTSPVASIRLGAAYALAKWGRAGDVLPVLLDATIDSDPYVRLYAVQVLEAMGPAAAPAKKQMQALLEDENKYVIRVATHALEQLGE